MSRSHADIRITILGSGTCVPSLERGSCAMLAQTGGLNLLFDVGPGTMHRLLENDITIFDISMVFLTHFHPDHTGELASFLFSSKYTKGKQKKGPLTLFGGNGFSDFFARLKKVYGDWISPDHLEVVELDNTAIREMKIRDSFLLTYGPTAHSPESIAYRVTGPGGRSVVYSGDTDYCESLIVLADKADLLVCESALPDELKVAGHLTPSLAGKIASRANVGKLILTHLYPECEGVDILAQCRTQWAGAAAAAQDHMVIELSS